MARTVVTYAITVGERMCVIMSMGSVLMDVIPDIKGISAT